MDLAKEVYFITSTVVGWVDVFYLYSSASVYAGSVGLIDVSAL